jgi:hypothetical protein
MALSLSDLIGHLKAPAQANDAARPSDAIWLRFSTDKTYETVEYRTADQSQIVHVYLDKGGALVGIEIFP